mmetsp:Transcript_34843/g.84276  ORF Transcript_34843/g.84276 Transcript_34843/m.84276 type:complete len:339 (+) Transcript_34843:3-1019(+)
MAANSSSSPSSSSSGQQAPARLEGLVKEFEGIEAKLFDLKMRCERAAPTVTAWLDKDQKAVGEKSKRLVGLMERFEESLEKVKHLTHDWHADATHFKHSLRHNSPDNHFNQQLYDAYHSSGEGNESGSGPNRYVTHDMGPLRTKRLKDDCHPDYYRSAGYDVKGEQFKLIKDGIDAARKYLGTYGSLKIYIVGGSNVNANRETLRTYEGDIGHILDKAKRDDGDAFCSGQPGHARALVFCNTHKFCIHGWNDKKLSTPGFVSTRGIHEYTHVFQGAYLQEACTWLEEGSAEFLAFYLGGKNNQNVLGSFEKQMMHVMFEIQKFRKRNPGFNNHLFRVL